MNLDIHDAVVTAVIVTLLGAIISAWRAVRSIRKGRNVIYYRIRHRLVSGGWWTIVFAAALVLLAILIGIFAEPIAYIYFPPSPTISPTPTITLTPTISLTPSITLTPTITLTPAISNSPTITGTPYMPDAIEAQFTSSVTPNPKAVFSPLQFSRSVEKYKPVNPQTVFQNPIQSIIVTYTFDGMTTGVQWTMLCYRADELVLFHTEPWGTLTGGSGQYKLDLPGKSGWRERIRLFSSWGRNGKQLVYSVLQATRPVLLLRLTPVRPQPIHQHLYPLGLSDLPTHAGLLKRLKSERKNGNICNGSFFCYP